MSQVLGRYHIISELGRGGMGVVYKALDPKLERFIAIKCLGDELSNDELVVARFLREARNVAALNHPNIAQVFVADEHEGKPFFVMEYVDGESLAEFIEREGQCSPEMARRVTEQAAEALAAAADENIVHRDVKPGNIMLDRRGRAVLTDFGIACVVADPSASEGSTTLMGTPGYLPPEALAGQPVDARGDIFSLGAVYFEMLTGRRLVEETGLKAMMSRFMDESFPDLSALEGRFDERVIEIIRRMLATNPEARYRDCRALLADMAPLKTGETGPVIRAESGPAADEKTAAMQPDAATGSGSDAGLAGGASATEEVAGEVGRRPETEPVAHSSGSGRAKRFGLLGALAVSLVMIGLGLARMDDGHWDRIAGLLPGEDQAETVAEDESERHLRDAPADAEAIVEEEPVVTGEVAHVSDPAQDDAARAGQSQVLDEQATDVEALVQPETGDDSEAPQVAGGQSREVAVEDSDSPERSPAPAVEEDSDPTVTATRPAEPAPPSGVAVIGVGDPVITEPMVREIEHTLENAGTNLVDERFIGDVGRFIYADDIDLSGLAAPALEAGARYVVVARAVSAGTRELEFYNRYETAYIVQLEAITFDLYQRRQIGASSMKQVEYTPLNATERARESVRPWLAGLREQLGR